MHVAFLTPEYPHELSTASGGLGTSIQSMANALVNYNIEVSIFIYGQKETRTVHENKIKLHFIIQKKYDALGWFRYRKYLQKYINGFIKSDGIDLIEVPDWTGIIAFVRFKCPVVMRLNGSDAYFCHLEGRKQKFKNRFFEKIAYQNADAIVSVSDFTGKITNRIFRLHRDYSVIPNSVDTDNFLPSTAPIVKNTILYFGTIIRKKGVLELAHIFNQVIERKPEAKLILAGRDVVDIFENRSTLQIFKESLTEEAEKGVQYLGALSYKEVVQEIHKAGVIVLPSFAEAMPMTWLESMAMEKLLVTSNIGWAKEVMIDEETGYMVDPKKHSEYAGKVIELLDGIGISTKFGKSARERILMEFDAKVIAKKNIAFYEKILGLF
jgi:L-malate glycosyltransferase